ncbi:MAG: sodium:solute symporter family protein [Planctomycetaceae bacterium]|nr:sodium:solute symporter family protein [Planctomycetales bacterium]MCB9927598.1 sodium:solute symporter family protein [Planctomycetaceae bacterium]
MNDQLIPFTPGEMVFIGIYLASLVVIGLVGYRAREENSLKDFYLAGNGIGFVVLLLTLYSTQYSGNTLFAFTGKTYRVGFAWTVCVHFMTSIVVFYLLLAPKLFRLAKHQGFITPTDFIEHRFRSPALSCLASLLMIIAIANFLLAQLMAMGNAVEGLTTFDPIRAYAGGVIILALVIVVYETLGGFRAVAWTDVIQGSVLLVGFVVLLILVFREFGSLAEATQIVRQVAPEKVSPPNWAGSREWASYVLIVGIGGALYPQAIQRIYAANSATTLRRSLIVMAFLPLTTALIALIVGIIGLAHIPDLARSDTLLTVICRRVQEHSLVGRWLVVVLFSAILAAIMSTADSVLLSISSMLTKDLYGRYLNPQATEKHLTRVGKICSWALIAVLVILAIQLRDTTLVKLLDRKFDLLVQLAPAFFIGLHWPTLRATPTLLGIIAGLAVVFGILAVDQFSDADYSKVAGIHPGLFGLAVNAAIAVCGTLYGRRTVD